MTAWALIPARGGSKSIPGKNLIPVNGIPLIDYGIRAALAADCFTRIVCSTDDDDIAAAARRHGIEIDERAETLAGDLTPIADVCRVFLEAAEKSGPLPDWLYLVQPTSPFLLPEHVKGLKALADDASGANSAQTVAPVPHNHHAWNQRTKTADRVSFVFHAERSEAYNKQRKPAYYVFGNLVAARSAALLSGMDFFAEPSVAMDILRPYDFDLDTQDDIVVAEALIASAAVSLPHMNSEVL